MSAVLRVLVVDAASAKPFSSRDFALRSRAVKDSNTNFKGNDKQEPKALTPRYTLSWKQRARVKRLLLRDTHSHGNNELESRDTYSEIHILMEITS